MDTAVFTTCFFRIITFWNLLHSTNCFNLVLFCVGKNVIFGHDNIANEAYIAWGNVCDLKGNVLLLLQKLFNIRVKPSWQY